MELVTRRRVSPSPMSNTSAAPSPTEFQSLKTYVGFTEASSRLLREVCPLVAAELGPIIDDFYATVERHAPARRTITGGPAQIARLKRTLRRWFEELLLGPHDEAYWHRRAQIGRVHVRIELPQSVMFTAIDRVRIQADAAVSRALAADPVRCRATLDALHQILDLDLAIMLETYRDDLVAKNRAAERLATIGQFAAGIGHELRNPLAVVASSVYLLRQYLGPADAKVERHLDKITAESKRAEKTIDDLLELARDRPPKTKAVPLDDLVTGAIANSHLPARVQVRASVAAAAVGWLDEDQVARVISNLLTNAAQAQENQGTIWVEAQSNEAETQIRVRDDGPGVPEDIRHRIFEALFTTKAQGSGLGLALCRRIVEAHGGSLALEPSSAGASFLMRIPQRAAPERPS
jgi:two-component system sensor histidine kinase HydH